MAIALTAIGVTGLCGCATTAREYREPAPLAAAARPAHNLAVYDAAWRLVSKKYFDPKFRGVDWRAQVARYRPQAEAAADDDALYRVINQLCLELRESHLCALPPRRVHEITTSRRTAVGMAWKLLDGRRVVTEVIPGSPAARAGVQAGWIVVTRNGVPMEESVPTPPKLGETVTFGFVDLQQASRAIVFAPELLPLDQLIARELPGGALYLRFDQFNRESLQWLSRNLKEHRPAAGVVIDLRQNPGGYLFSCKLALGEFFPQRVATGEFISRRGRVHGERGFALFSANYHGPVVVLTSAGTGSAAEIFAHVMQHEHRATVVGRRTAGAVIVSRNYPLPGGGQLQIPVQDYRGRDGQRLEGRGVLPDIGVPPAGLADIQSGFDPDVATALASLDVELPALAPDTLLTAQTAPAGTAAAGRVAGF